LKEYFKENNLLNKEHYGWNFDYERSKLFSKGENSDGLRMSLIDMNDLEYKNTNNYNNTTFTDKLLISEIKYYHNTNSIYADIQLQKYNDISSDNDDDVMQVMPKIQFHKYTDNNIVEDISYSIDVKSDIKTRKVGVKAKTTTILIPLTYSKEFFNKFLNFDLTNQLKFSSLKYGNTNIYTDANMVQNLLVASLSTDIIKKFSKVIHSFNLKASYSKPSTLSVSGDIYGVNGAYQDDEELSLFPISNDIENFNISLNQSFFSSKSLKTIVNHKINQSIIYNENKSDEITLGALENEVSLYFSNASFINKISYSHERKKILSKSFALKLFKDSYFANFDYSSLVDTSDFQSESIIVEVGAKIGKNYTVKYKEQYDFTNEISKIKEYSLSVDNKCWQFGLKLADNLVAAATQTQNPIRQNILYATITLKPIVSYTHTYKEDEEDEEEN
jgi:LPS-assembly protein